MKKLTFLFILVLTSSLLLFTSCNQDDEPNVTSYYMDVSITGIGPTCEIKCAITPTNDDIYRDNNFKPIPYTGTTYNATLPIDVHKNAFFQASFSDESFTSIYFCLYKIENGKKIIISERDLHEQPFAIFYYLGDEIPEIGVRFNN